MGELERDLTENWEGKLVEVYKTQVAMVDACRWECEECDALDTESGKGALKEATRFATRHTEETGHEVLIVRLVRRIEPVRSDG